MTPRHVKGTPLSRETVISSERKRAPEITPKMGVRKVKAESRLAEYRWSNLNQPKKLMKATTID
jgi:hypothetical protein